MDGFEEKKWFVYLGDHHEGPFSLADVQDKMGQAQVTPSSYVWADGMPDWQVMREVPAFESLVEGFGHPTGNGGGNGQATEQAEPPVQPAPVEPAAPMFSAEPSVPEPMPPQEEPSAVNSIEMQPELVSRAPEAPQPRGPRPRILPKILGVLLVLVFFGGVAAAYLGGYLNPLLKSPALQAAAKTIDDYTQPYLYKAIEKVPALGRWVSPIPRLSDVSGAEYADLRTAASAAESAGPHAALAISTANLNNPSFYVATNLPDGAHFDVWVQGVQETLLNQLSFNDRTSVVAVRRLGKSEPVKLGAGQPLPRGEYEVFVTEDEANPPMAKDLLALMPPSTAPLPMGAHPGLKIVLERRYFLGGPQDATYAARLKDFHDKLREKAQGELSEVKQFAGTLQSQLDATVGGFKLFGGKLGGRHPRKPPPSRRKGWMAFHGHWVKLESKLDDSFSKWTPEALQTDFFYGTLYQLTQQAGQAVDRVHELQTNFFAGKTDPRAFEIQIGEAIATARAAITGLNAKVEQAEKLAPSPNGMPRRDGI